MKKFLISLFLLLICSCQSTESENSIAIVIHGDAGTILKENMTPELESAYLNKLEEAVQTGYEILKNGGSSQSAVEETIKIMEDSPLFNAGIGAALTNQETASLDASFMEGDNLDAGAVAGSKYIKNPITGEVLIKKGDMIDEFGSEEKEQEWVKSQIFEHVITPVVPSSLINGETEIVVNGTGRFADPGGPYADAGLTGRKIIVDTYGGRGRHGGGAFSGKDPSKVDRSAAYASRWAAKHVVASGLSRECEIQLAYAIGVAKPVSVRVDTFGTGLVPDEMIASLVSENFDFRPGHIIRNLGLKAPIYGVTASGGHFGRVPSNPTQFTWERLDDTIISAFQAVL